jgi:hypothetical protein
MPALEKQTRRFRDRSARDTFFRLHTSPNESRHAVPFSRNPISPAGCTPARWGNAETHISLKTLTIVWFTRARRG